MSTLFVIGNGFDSEHKLKTSYWDFMMYLERYDEEFLSELEGLYGLYRYEPNGHESEYVELQLIKKSRNRVYDCFWKNVEYELGYADEIEMESFSDSIVRDMDMESGPIGIEDTLNQYWEEQYSFVKKLNELIYRWAKQIRYFKAVPKSTKLKQNESDLFLTFNYTNTLEKIYEIPDERVLHIHGGLLPHCNLKPVLGHGNKEVIEKYRNLAREAHERFDEGNASIYNAIATMYERTLKNTSNYTSSLLCFLLGAKEVNIDTVEVIGHSLGDVDLPYFRIIKDVLGSNTKWIVYYHKIKEEIEFKTKISQLGISDDLLTTLPSDAFFDKN